MQSRKRGQFRWVTMLSVAMAAGMWDAAAAGAAELKPETAAAFETYIRESEVRMHAAVRTRSNFLWIEGLPEKERGEAEEELGAGKVVVKNAGNADGGIPVVGGLIHDWRGAVFVPGIKIAEALEMLEDYDRDAEVYGPDVVRSKLLKREGDDFQVYLRLRRKYVVTAVFDTEYDIQYATLDATRAYANSRSTRIREVENADETDEQDAPVGEDRGFLWRLNSYWRFKEKNGGVYIECEAISLTRGVPEELGWLVKPFTRTIPRESLRFTLEATRNALLKKYGEPAAGMGSAAHR
jgi:hypothetical protein